MAWCTKTDSEDQYLGMTGVSLLKRRLSSKVGSTLSSHLAVGVHG